MDRPVESTPHHTLTITSLAYLPAVAAMMTIGVLVPFIDSLCTDLSATRAEIGLAIALFSTPSAVFATVGGGLIDSYGLRRSMCLAACASAAGSMLASRSQSVLALDGAMLVAGLGFGALCVGLPCLIMAALHGGARIRAMSFASTFAPTGYAAGLLLAVPFTAGGAWRFALICHAAIMLVTLIALAVAMPAISSVSQPPQGVARRLSGLFGLFREPRALRLGLAVALPNALSYGTSLAAPSYLARVHHLSLATSSASVALAKLAAMIIGGLSMGYLLSRAVAPRLLFAVMAVIGLMAQALLFLPARGIALATMALIIWLFAFGGMAGGAMTLLPTVTRNPNRGGAASGLVNQFISVASFAAPSTWLALHDGGQYVLLAAACLLVSSVALPGAVVRRPTA
ncbi:MAG TPA: MFS transporter [Steroidobacteraceae bacterium]|nr:MFS transporter [Steroidobacteraceae bacterium]